MSSRTVFEVLGLGLEGQVLGLENWPVLGRGLLLGFLLPFKTYISLKLF